MEIVHTTVMGGEALEYLAPDRPDALLIDCTLGEGGHSELFLRAHPGLRVVGLDADSSMLDKARVRLAGFGARFEARLAWFDDFFRSYPLDRRPDRILFDLGVSMVHFSTAERGFSLRGEGPLDMRLDPSQGRTAADLVNQLPETELADLIFELGEERYSRRIARAVARRRAERRLSSTSELAELIYGAVPAAYRRSRIHPATRSFQALRIAVNRELERLQTALPAAFAVLAPGGRLGALAFHSLEDRIVKRSFLALAGGFTGAENEPKFSSDPSSAGKILTRKPLRPSPQETAANPAARSACFRVIEKVGS